MTGHDRENFELLEKAVQQFQDDPEIRLLYATILLKFRPDDVASQASKAVDLAPDNPRILVRAGHLMFNRGAVEAARSCAARADELAQPGFVLMSDLANLHGLLDAFDKEYDLAEENFRSAVEGQPDNASFAVDLAKFLAARARPAEAIEVLDRALERTDILDQALARADNPNQATPRTDTIGTLKRVRSEISQEFDSEQ